MGKDRQGVSTGLRRGDVARMLGVHVTTVRRYEARGLLRPTGGTGEERVFDEAQVHALARMRGRDERATADRDDGATDAAAIRMFRAGATVERVIIALELPADRVSALFDQWRTAFVRRTPKRDAGETNDERDASDRRAFAAWERELAAAHAAPNEWAIPRARTRTRSKPST